MRTCHFVVFFFHEAAQISLATIKRYSHCIYFRFVLFTVVLHMQSSGPLKQFEHSIRGIIFILRVQQNSLLDLTHRRERELGPIAMSQRFLFI